MTDYPTNSLPDPNSTPVRPRRTKVPRINSLEHRLRYAQDADGRLIPLRDQLLCFLDHPPKGTGDRWQEGADLCRRHGIQTSRMSVWRFHRAQSSLP